MDHAQKVIRTPLTILVGTVISVALTAQLAAAAPTASKTSPVVGTTRTALGTFLVDARGRTLYLFQNDKPNVSHCLGPCAHVWPPDIVSGPAKAHGKAKASLLGSLRRPNGTLQATYAGHPLYRYEGDSKNQQVNGQGLKQFGAFWYVVAPGGKKIDNG